MYKHFFTPEFIKMGLNVDMHIYVFTSILGKLLSHLGSLRLNEGLVESAEDLLTEARDAVETSGNLTAKATIMYNLGLLRSGGIIQFTLKNCWEFDIKIVLKTPKYLYKLNIIFFLSKLKLSAVCIVTKIFLNLRKQKCCIGLFKACVYN